MEKDIKKLDNYIKNIKEHGTFSKENIVVEHRSNNPKRDYLFVNKLQCKHIPASPSKMVAMCNELADMVNNKLKDTEIVVIAFAETATAIGNCVADRLNNCKFVLQTTREDELRSIGKNVINFEEEHSHATTQMLLIDRDCKEFSLEDYNGYILFVEDEISTGNTILNFINAMNNVKPGLKYGVASICNWQNKENSRKFSDAGIDTYFLLGGNLADEKAIMITDDKYICKEKMHGIKLVEEPKVVFNKRKMVSDFDNLFANERLGHKPNRDLIDILNKVEYMAENLDIKSIRIVGTEEFMYIPIKVGEFLESKGYSVVCHATTRSPIDALDTKLGADGITERYRILSPYADDRHTMIYNLDKHVDWTLVISDKVFDAYTANNYYDTLKGDNTDKCDAISFLFV